MKYFNYIILFYIVIQNVTGLPRVDPLVETEHGYIRGLISEDGTYSMFMGIPYAYINQSNPFGPAIPNKGFQNTFEAYDDSAYCPQYAPDEDIITGTFDCLHLNVYVPQSASTRNPLPVLVWIHGGGFMNGLAGKLYYDPKFIMNTNIILITINYRLGPYGFMCLNTPEVPGNQGLKDQKLALKWIKDNVAAFGGDANEITISGESAGGASVDLHLLYNHERPFNKVIIQSGTAQSPFTVQVPDTEAPLKLSEHLGFRPSDLDEALKYLSAIHPHLLIASATELNLSFVPCIEQDFGDADQFILEHPRNKNINNLRNIPILIGVTSREAVPFITGFENDINNFVNDLIQSSLAQEFKFSNDDEHAAMVKIIRNMYIGDGNNYEESRWSVIDFYSDFFFDHPTVRSVDKYLALGARNIYQYLFSYVGTRNFQYVAFGLNNSDDSIGAAHFDDVGYLFDMAYLDEPSDQDQLVIDRMTTLWSNFVKYGNPTPMTSELIPVSWPTVTQDTMPYLDINNDLAVTFGLFRERMAFWDLFYKLNNNAIIGYNSENN